MIKLNFVVILLSVCLSLSASDSLFVYIEKHELKNNDTLNFECAYKYENVSRSKITLNVVIENIEKTKQWKFRYPLINGSASPAIIVGKDIPEGKYAISFLIQNDFLRVKGKIRDYNSKSKGINFILLTKDKDAFLDFLAPDKQGYFTTKKMLFEDTARVVFSEIGRKNQYLYIDLENYLDSSFTPIAMLTEFITIGTPLNIMDSSKILNYKFDFSNQKNYTLTQALVNSTTKKKVTLFDEAYSSGLFKFGSSQIFDGLESNQIGNSIDIFTFLQGRIAGLIVNKDNAGSYKLKWREGPVDVYLDEFKVDNDFASYINTNDIAMIKVFSPIGGGPSLNGSIAIYTKRGAFYSENSSRKYNFQVRGYNPQTEIWK